jgi:hypothetical protein
MATNNAIPSAQEVPNATKGFVEWFIQRYQGAEYWTSAGFNLARGKPPFPKMQLSKLITPTYRLFLSAPSRSRLSLDLELCRISVEPSGGGISFLVCVVVII